MEKPSKRELLEACPVADQAVWRKHIEGFVRFITSTKRERWQEQLTGRPRRIGRHSHKMHSDLDRRVCANVGWKLPDGLKGEGLFYDFSGELRVVPVELLMNVDLYSDAIYSLVPGKLAFYFFHEGEVWMCQAAGTLDG